MALTSLTDASVFKYAEMMGAEKITSTIASFVQERNGTVFVTEEQMEDVFYKIRHKSFTHPAKFAVLNMFRKGLIRLAYSERTKLTVAVPFFKYKMQGSGGFGIVINISNYAKMKPDGSVTMDPEVLYTLMIAGVFSLVLDRNLSILVNGGIAELYSALFATVMAKVVNLDSIKREKIKFISSKFMYMQLGVNEPSASKVAARNIKGMLPTAIEQLDLSIPAASYENLETLIKGINEAFPEFSGLSLGVFFDRWMRTYGEFSAFACEYVPMFVSMFMALIINCNSMINVKAIEKEASRHDTKLIQLFNRIETIVTEMSQK